MDLQTLQRRLFAPVDIAGLAFFRIAFGLIMLVEVYRYFANGFIRRYWIETPVNFGYPGFEWVQRMPPLGMYALFAVLGLLAVCIMLGLAYRTCIRLFCLGWTYVFLLEQALYLNHFYLLCLLALILSFLPANRKWSLDVWRNPALRSETTPAWTVWILRAQLTIVYFFGGVAKINADWLAGDPMRLWMAELPNYPVLGPWFREEWLVYFMSYSGLLLDLLIAPALLWRPTRTAAFLVITLFHVMNSQLFPIGIFPWFMILGTTIFLPSDWPRRVLRFMGLGNSAEVQTESAPPLARDLWPSPRRERFILAVLGLYLLVQVTVPWRHLLMPGDASWTEEGHLFAWRMKLRDKRGPITFIVRNPVSGMSFRHDPKKYLASYQVRVMAFSPDLIHQYALHLAKQMRDKGFPQVEVRCRSLQSLNGYPPQQLINPEVDLAAQPRSWLPAPWIEPRRLALESQRNVASQQK